MDFENEKGRERPSAPRPQGLDNSSAVVELENPKEAKLLEQHEDNNASFGETEAPAEKKSGSSAKKIKALTDVPALRDYLHRIGAVPRSLKTAVITEQEGKYQSDIATIRVEKDGTVAVKLAYRAASDAKAEDYAPTEAEAAEIKAALAGYAWPAHKIAYTLVGAPDAITKADPESLFEFRDGDGGIIMIQRRIEDEHGKSYVPYTLWDDDEWRCAEPEGPLPLYNGHLLKGGASTVFVHEGAKAARHAQWLADGKSAEAIEARRNHPWGDDLRGGVHVGWIGGAKAPDRTDWGAIKSAGAETVYIVADNDDPGRSAVPKIAQALRCLTYVVQFSDDFPISFDLADQFPDEMFDDKGNYSGPSFKSCRSPATWMTDQVSNPEGKGRPVTVLRDHVRKLWAYIEEIDAFVCRDAPSEMRNESVLNKMLAPFSHVAETSKLIVKAYQGRSVKLAYRPDKSGTSIKVGDQPAINVYVPPRIKAGPGDPKLFLDFLAYMFPNASERVEVERWIATLIARPEVRIGYGLLLISEKQGIGKTTLGSSILAPLVGQLNVSVPGQKDFESGFNEWVANKRLAIVNEIYSGASWKVYHQLKSIITDEEVTVNQKYVRQYKTENWIHIFACSNSRRALKMEESDRRWFVPEVTEVPWPRERFKALRSWLKGDGLRIVRRWAEEHGNYVEDGEIAPETAMKRDMITGSRSEAQAEAAALAEALVELKKPAAFAFKQVVDHIKGRASGKVYDSDYELRRAMTERGLKVLPERIKVSGRREYVLVNAELAAELERTPEAGHTDLVRERIERPSRVLPDNL